MGRKARAEERQERREKRLLEITRLRAIPYTDAESAAGVGEIFGSWLAKSTWNETLDGSINQLDHNFSIYFGGSTCIRLANPRKSTNLITQWWSSETIAVVTGSNQGIGYEIARSLAAHGLTVILAARNPVKGLEAKKALQKEGLDVLFHQLDVSDSTSVEEFANWIAAEYGGLDILVNNAGVNFNVGSENSAEFAEEVIATNYFGTKRMTESMVPLMKPSASGARVVNVSSRLGRLNGRRNRLGDVNMRNKLAEEESLSEELIEATINEFLEQVKHGSWVSGGWPQNFTDYSVSKLAVNAYTRLMAKKNSDQPEGHKIYINCYCPGWVKTAMTGWQGNISAEEAADTGVWIALQPNEPTTGKFFAERREISF